MLYIINLFYKKNDKIINIIYKNLMIKKLLGGG